MVSGSKGSWPIAGTIGLTFGGLWSSLGAMGVPHQFRVPFEGLGLLVTMLLIVGLWRRRAPAEGGGGLFRRRGYIIAVILEIVAIYVASTLLSQNGLRSFIIPTVGVIVGLHFIGLWQATRLPSFLWIAAGMCAVSVFAACLPEVWGEFGPRNLMAGFGNACVLWVGAGRSRKASQVGPGQPTDRF
jgi:hypothetical protein